jgi:hypothetical protein
MSYSYTAAVSTTFTETHARHIASRVATDLKRLQRFYHHPTDAQIESYEMELIQLLKAGALKTVTYGFRRGDSWIEPTLIYTSRDLLSGNTASDDPGKIRPGANVLNAYFHSYLTYSDIWQKMSQGEKEKVIALLPFRRSTAAEPTISGVLVDDRSYSAGGRALQRASVRSF